MVTDPELSELAALKTNAYVYRYVSVIRHLADHSPSVLVPLIKVNGVGLDIEWSVFKTAVTFVTGWVCLTVMVTVCVAPLSGSYGLIDPLLNCGTVLSD